MWYVYILKSEDRNWHYVGSTNDISKRLKEHNNKKVRSTKGFVPLKLIYKKSFDTEGEARKFEKKIKDKRKLKEKIIESTSSPA